MKMYLINVADNVDTYRDASGRSRRRYVVHEQDELKQALERVLEDKSRNCTLTEKFGREFPAIIDIPIGT